jgi:hypothetical protein
MSAVSALSKGICLSTNKDARREALASDARSSILRLDCVEGCALARSRSTMQPGRTRRGPPPAARASSGNRRDLISC